MEYNLIAKLLAVFSTIKGVQTKLKVLGYPNFSTMGRYIV